MDNYFFGSLIIYELMVNAWVYYIIMDFEIWKNIMFTQFPINSFNESTLIE